MIKRISFSALTAALAISLLALASTDARAASVEELTKQLQASLTEDITALSRKFEKGKGQDGAQGEMDAQMQMQLQMFQRALQSGAIFSSETEYGDGRGLQGLAAMAPSEKSRKLAMELAAELKKAEKEKEAIWLRETEETLRVCLQKGFAAKTAKEIDTLLAEVGRLTRYSSDRYNRSASVRTLTEEAGTAKEFLRQWQDYLAATEAGNNKGARETLSRLTNYSRGDLASFIPRSEMLAKLNALQPAEPVEKPKISVAAIVEQTKTLEDLPKAAEAIRQSGRDSYSAGSDSQLANELRTLARHYEEIKNGVGVNSFLGRYTGSRYDSTSGEQLTRLRMQLLLVAIAQACNLELARSGETVSGYLQRMMENARQRKD